jgi:hypothetical protein
MAAAQLAGQEAGQEAAEAQGAAPNSVSHQLAIVHGVVRNMDSGEPLARALVRIDGDATTGVLTDGDGRFELTGVPVGPQELEAIKPGYLDGALETGESDLAESRAGYAHNVMVAAEMPDVVFNLAQANSIRGQIQLSSGDPAQGIGVTLLKRTVQDGRAAWHIAGTAKSNSEGVYRLGGLANGLYAVYTEPAMDSDAATNLVEAGSGKQIARGGYPSTFYPDSRDLAGAAKIKLAGGEQSQTNLSLTLEPFQSVTAFVTYPGGGRDNESSSGPAVSSLSPIVLDPQGHLLPYTAQYDQATHTIQAFLPDGSYSLMVTATLPFVFRSTTIGKIPVNDPPLTGMVDFAIAGHAVSNLRVPLATTHSSPVQLIVNRSGGSAPQGNGGVFITLSQTGGWISDGMVSSYAQGSSAGPLETSYTPPGTYWVHTSIAQRGLCEASFTAGGASLAREPLAIAVNGGTAPLTLTLRDDCASLTLSLPPSLGGPTAGEELFYTVYVVPDFDTTQDVVPQTLRPSSGATVTLAGLTPGSYHVYTFAGVMNLEYRSAAVLAARGNPGQAVTLSSSGTSELVLEAPQQ